MGRFRRSSLLGERRRSLRNSRAPRFPNGSRYILYGREEDSTIHDEVGMRHFYAEWGRRRMGRPASDPTRKLSAEDPAKV